MTLTGSVIFMANKARLGGGISIQYNSDLRKCYNPNFIIFQEPLDLLFLSNSARNFGGVLYIEDANSACRQSNPLYYSYCFLTMNGSTKFVKLNFTGNKASVGTGIYGGAIQYCEVGLLSERQKGYKVLQNRTKTSTEIQHKYANLKTYETHLCNGTTSPIRVQRGQVFNISVTVLGEFDVPVYESVAFTIDSLNHDTSIELIGQLYNYLNEKGCRNLGLKILNRYQAEHITLYLPQCFDKPGSLTVHIDLDDCPRGFELILNSCKCQETFFNITHHDLCDSGTGLIKCPQQDWIKPILDENLTYEGFMWSPNCPAHLCRNDKDK